MSDLQVKIVGAIIKDKTGKVHGLGAGLALYAITEMSLTEVIDGYAKTVELDESCEIKEGDSEWYSLTSEFCENFKIAGGDIQVMKMNEEAQLRKEAKIARKIEDINQLKLRCENNTWSLDDLKYLAELLQGSDTAQEDDSLCHARKELIEGVVKNPSLTEPIKLMYAKAQLELQQQLANSQHDMQQQILNNLEQLSSNQAQSNSILRQNQKRGNQKVALGMLGGIAALNKLDDISDSLGGDE